MRAGRPEPLCDPSAVIDAWSLAVLAPLLVLIAALLRVVIRDRDCGRLCWRAVVLSLAAASAAAALLPPLDEAGDDGLLTAHLAQHIALGDLVAPLMLLALPTPLRARLARMLCRWYDGGGWLRRAATVVVSPPGAFVLWVIATYFWLLPPVHRAAAEPGWLQAIDHLSFLAFGLAIWLIAFDPRPRAALWPALRRGGMPLWARHLYAMGSRVALLLPALLLFGADPGRYHEGTWSFSFSEREDQRAAASIWVGFEMGLFTIAVMLAFVFVILRQNSAPLDTGIEPGTSIEHK
jgi:putative membrane protein